MALGRAREDQATCVTHGIVGGPAVGGYLVQGGPLARSVEDLALALSLIVGSSRDDPFAMANPPIRDWRKVSLRNLRVAFHLENGIVAPTLATQNTVRRAAEALSSEVLAIEESTPPRIEETYELYGSLTVPNAVDAYLPEDMPTEPRAEVRIDFRWSAGDNDAPVRQSIYRAAVERRVRLHDQVLNAEIAVTFQLGLGRLGLPAAGRSYRPRKDSWSSDASPILGVCLSDPVCRQASRAGDWE
jgi:Asp-tRNA(Asn)/Glu-tRNA(Gln) amidotransferase A subunit family amidase